MDTPERNQIGTTSLSKFEDSPVFNYINSLSPIEPVKSTHVTQTLNSFSFTALPSVFTSPHAVSHRESRFLIRHSNPSKPEFSSENGNKVCTGEGIFSGEAQSNDRSEESRKNFDPKASGGDKSVETPNERNEEPDNVKQVSYIQVNSENGPSGAEGNPHGISNTEQIKERTGYDWKSLISDSAELLFLDSPASSEAIGVNQKPVEPVTGLSPSFMPQFVHNDCNCVHEMTIVGLLDSSGKSGAKDLSSQSGESSDLKDIDKKSNNLSSPNLNVYRGSNVGEKEDIEPVSNLHRGVRRRCLDFEMAGTCRRNIYHGSNSDSVPLPPDENAVSNEEKLIAIKSTCDSSRILTGIGLHLNALATTSSKDYKDANDGNLSSERQEPLLTSSTSERQMDPSENGVQLEEDVSHSSAYVLGGEFNKKSPQKKQKLEDAADIEGCKRCNCKKSKCLKLYCECFAAGVYCIEPCSCLECFNKPIHEDIVLATRKQIESRNPLAFAPKVIRSSGSLPEVGNESGNTPASARHKRGCNCKKSSCLKKYCECYQGGVGCSISCRCEGCKNAFGRKDACAIIGRIETEQEEETETERSQKSFGDNAFRGTEIQTNEEQNRVPATPLQLCRPFAPLLFSSSSKLKHSYILHVGSSSRLCAGQQLEQTNILGPQPKFEKCVQTVSEDEMPEILCADRSPSSGIKTASPNSKRVSPPQSNFGKSPIPRIGRKLILQSIPSFPSLTSQH